MSKAMKLKIRILSLPNKVIWTQGCFKTPEVIIWNELNIANGLRKEKDVHTFESLGYFERSFMIVAWS